MNANISQNTLVFISFIHYSINCSHNCNETETVHSSLNTVGQYFV